jgi:hypothetical protein
MLRLVQVGNTLPASFICDPSAEFQPGQCGELVAIGNQVMCTVSSGIAPIGIIDEIKTRAFTNVSWNEVLIAPATGVPGPGGVLVTPVNIQKELRKANIVRHSFTSNVNVVLNPVNGVVTFLAGTPLNLDLTGGGTPNAIQAIVSYTYYVPNIPGDDSTQGSGRVTIWFSRMFAQTNVFETSQAYPIRANLYCSENGLLTTRRPSKLHPSIALVTAPPTPMNPMIEFLLL